MNPSPGPTSIEGNGVLSPRVLCISLGSIGRRHLRNARALLPGARIGLWRQHTSGAALPPEANLSLARLDEALAFEPDLVLLSSPASEHLANALPFVERGIPVFLEKPLAASSHGVDTFEAACARSPGFTMVGYVLRFLPALHTIRSAITHGELGLVRLARVEVGQYLPDWRPDADYRQGVSAQRALGGGALLELSHEIDYATWLFGWPSTVQCSTARVGGLEIDVEDTALLTLEYPDKRVAVQLDFLQRVARMSVEIVGSIATLHADLIKEDISIVEPGHPQGRVLEADRLPNGNDLYLRQFDFFFHKALPGYRPAYASSVSFDQHASVAQAASVLRLVDRARQADARGTRQAVDALTSFA